MKAPYSFLPRVACSAKDSVAKKRGRKEESVTRREAISPEYPLNYAPFADFRSHRVTATVATELPTILVALRPMSSRWSTANT